MSTVKSPGTVTARGALEIDALREHVDTEISHPVTEGQHRIDRRLAFLARASARFDLVKAGAMTLDEALEDPFVEDFRAVAEITCHCEREMLERWDRDHPQPQRTHRRVFRDSAVTSVVDAVLLELSRYGLPRLNNKNTQARIAELSVDQLLDVITRLVRMKPRYPQITAEFLDVLRDQIK